jgi:hypothetical protein
MRDYLVRNTEVVLLKDDFRHIINPFSFSSKSDIVHLLK